MSLLSLQSARYRQSVENIIESESADLIIKINRRYLNKNFMVNFLSIDYVMQTKERIKGDNKKLQKL